jgi:hypothetical protein
MQHIHLEPYAIIKKNKHILIINNSDHYKIVINSLEVYFGITRQHAEVGHKKSNYFYLQKSSRQILHK